LNYETCLGALFLEGFERDGAKTSGFLSFKKTVP